MDFEVHFMSILHTELSLFNYDKVTLVLQSMTPLRAMGMAETPKLNNNRDVHILSAIQCM